MSDFHKTQNDEAWEALFEKYDILGQIDKYGKFIISASQIKEYREPRLMAKFDHNINLPRIFFANHLAILPISRGDYVISHFTAYQPFSSLSRTVKYTSLPNYLQSLDANNISSEAVAINCALASGMLADFLDEDMLQPTVSGRMKSGQFDFSIHNLKTNAQTEISVNNSQIEIDAAFEGIHSLSLLEAKLDLAEDFLVRQLYYPFRAWNNRLTKTVRPIFLVYTNGIFSLYEYKFQDPNSYNSLVLCKHKNYSIEETSIALSDIQDVAMRVQIVPEPTVSFPQANSFERVINICELLNMQELSREKITEEYAFDIRQTNYYTDAARYLGLLDKQYEEGRKPLYCLTSFGKRVMQLGYKQRQLAFCKAILQHHVFNEAFKLCMRTGCVPESSAIVEIMQKANLYKVESMSTYTRRSSTIASWINWMLGLVEE